MTRARCRLLFVYTLVALSIPAFASAPAQTTATSETGARGISVVEARADVLADVIEHSGATTAVPRPGVAAYVAFATTRLVEAIVGWLSPLGRYAGGIGSTLAWVAGILVAISLIVVLWALGRYLLRRFGGSSLAENDNGADTAVEPEAVDRARDRDEWRAELEGRLALADVNGALEATWWWLARAVLGERVRSSWTSGELLHHARRPALRGPLRTLERLMYGGVAPSVDEVRALAHDLEETLA